MQRAVVMRANLLATTLLLAACGAPSLGNDVEVTRSGTGLIPCSTDADCGQGRICDYFGFCVPSACQQPVTAMSGQPTVECPEGYYCDYDICVPESRGSCATSETCAAGYVCLYGSCMPGHSDGGQPAWQGDGGSAGVIVVGAAPDGGTQQCAIGATQGCSTHCGTVGVQSCDGQGRWGDCRSTVRETNCADRLDDDCDGQIDLEDADCKNGCVVNATRACATACGSVGKQACDGAGHWGRCEPPPVETACDDGRDDDCDGKADRQDADCGDRYANCADGNKPFVNCHSTDGTDAKAQIPQAGWHDGSHCDERENYAHCLPEVFQAWCHFDDRAWMDKWTALFKDWVDDRCDGAISLEYIGNDRQKGTPSLYVCVSSAGVTYQCRTPLVLAFLPDVPVVFETIDVDFFLDAARPLRSDWPSAATPWLALDRDGNGRIDDGSELLGDATPIAGGTARDGFEALASLDDNRDGMIDARDAAWPRLRLWFDRDRDGRSTPAELTTLGERGVTALSLDARDVPHCDARGNCERQRAQFTFVDGQGAARAGAVIDLHLRVEPPLCSTH